MLVVLPPLINPCFSLIIIIFFSLQGNDLYNLNLAFDVAEKHLDIPKMLDAEGKQHGGNEACFSGRKEGKLWDLLVTIAALSAVPYRRLGSVCVCVCVCVCLYVWAC